VVGFPLLVAFGFVKRLNLLRNSYGMFAVTSAGGTEFIQDGDFFTTGGIFIP
jgi:hypothetical protein